MAEELAIGVRDLVFALYVYMLRPLVGEVARVPAARALAWRSYGELECACK